MHAGLQQSKIQYYTDHSPPSSLLPTLTTAASRPVHTQALLPTAVWCLRNCLFTSLLLNMTTLNYSLFYQDSILQRLREREWLSSPKTWNLMSSFSVLFQHTECHTFSSQGGINSAQKVRGISYPNHWISETNKTTKKFNNLWEEYNYSLWWNRAQSCPLRVSRITAFRSEKKRKTNSLRKFYGKKNYESIYECNH